jgi:para-aminobenzoate synthetase component I
LNQKVFIEEERLRHYPHYRQQLLDWAQRYSSCSFLDNREYASVLHLNDFLAGMGVLENITVFDAKDMKALDDFITSNRGRWIFGHISYDLREVLHGTPSLKEDKIGFARTTFFVPAIVCRSLAGGLEIQVQESNSSAEEVWTQITAIPARAERFIQAQPVMQPRMQPGEYINTIQQLKKHILRGDCYEVNYCQEYFSKGVPVNPTEIYEALILASPNPFSCFYRQHNSFLMCASPERYLTRRGDTLFSQPIKGTALRNLNDPEADVAAREALLQSSKERSENVMVVDLVRNDLSRVCEKGSVQVDELFGLYTYPQVHQMISTISGIQQQGQSFSALLKATFPMGSMTGAPKKRVMELIEQYEPSKRGLFSGAVGYFDPSGDFDFNVVIRSILYNAENQYLSYQVGSGITWYSEPEKEYEECLWKAKAIRNVLGES